MASSGKVAITSVEGGNLTINAVEALDGIVFGGTAPVGSTLLVNDVDVPVDGTGTWTATLAPPTDDGPWQISAIATPQFGKPIRTFKALVVDRAPPQAAIETIQGGDDIITAAEAAGGVLMTGSAEVGSLVKVNNKAVKVDASGHWSIALKAPSTDGNWPISVVAKDAAGNTSTTTSTLQVQVKGPGVAFTSFEGGNTVINAAEAAGGVVIGGTTAAGSAVMVNGTAATVDGTGHWTANVTAPGQDGTWAVTAVAQDVRGNKSTVSKALMLDTTPPAVAITSIEGGDDHIGPEAIGGVDVAGTAEVGSTLKVNGAPVAVDPTGHWATTLTAPASGTWSVTATAIDAAGNSASASRTLDAHSFTLR